MSILADAKRPKIIFGNIPKTELTMSAYEKDSMAPAVVLFDYGELDIEKLVYYRYTKIKILKKDGYYLSDVSVPLFGSEEISNFRAATYNYRGGKMEISSVESKAKFTEEFIDGIQVYKWAMSDVQEGSVIEYEYYVSSESGFSLRDWEFQTNVPIAHSEFYLVQGTANKAQIFIQGYLTPNQVDENHWIMKNVPAFVEEPFIGSKKNYISKVNVELASAATMVADRSMRLPRYSIQFYNFSTDWSDVARSYRYMFAPNGQVKWTTFLEKQSNDIIAELKNPDDKVRAIHEYVQKTMLWNGRYSTGIRKKGLKPIIEEKTGTSGEINLMLLAMLRQIGLPADLVLLSTKENGFLRQDVPNRSQFNNVIVMTDYKSEKMLIDATSKFLPIEYIPESCLNGLGYWVKEANFEWIPLENPKAKNKTIVTTDLKLANDGSISVFLDYTKSGYEAKELRKALATEKETYALKQFKQVNPSNLKYEFLNTQDLSLPTKERYQFDVSDLSIKSGKSIYLKPVLFFSTDENPFKLETRIYPVDFGYPKELTYTAKISIPPGFEVEELPKAKMALLPEGGGKFIFNAVAQGNVITVINQFMLSKSFFAQTEYPDLREFYNIMAAKHAEQIILREK